MCEENKKKEVNIFLNNIYRFVEKEIAKGKYEKQWRQFQSQERFSISLIKSMLILT